MASASIISTAAGTIPRATIEETVDAALGYRADLGGRDGQEVGGEAERRTVEVTGRHDTSVRQYDRVVDDGGEFARGDLAAEIGFVRTAEIQEEILWVAEAAQVPVIWATQVLESLAKYGQPSRAEISDAAMSHRAECVMLNKGPFVAEAVGALDNILRRMEQHQYKKHSLYRRLHVQLPPTAP